MATEHNLEVGDKVLFDNQLFVAKNRKFSPMWIGPFEITKIINKLNVEVKIKKQIVILQCVQAEKIHRSLKFKFQKL